MPGFGNLVEIILDRRPLPGSPVSLEAATDGVDALVRGQGPDDRDGNLSGCSSDSPLLASWRDHRNRTVLAEHPPTARCPLRRKR